MLNSVQYGQKVEQSAIRFLEKKGFEILKKNYRQKRKELDIVAKQNKTLHLIEVKSSFSGLNPFFKRNIKTYIESKEFENLNIDISIDLLIFNKNKFNFYENISIDFIVSDKHYC